MFWMRVGVTEAVGDGGEHHLGMSSNLERLENRWIKAKKKLDHLGEGLHRAASQKHKGTSGSQ